MPIKINKWQLGHLFFFLISYIVWIIVYSNAENIFSDYYSNRMFLSWVGIILFVFYLISWRLIEGTWFSLMTVFLSFFMVFDFGQSFLWMFGFKIQGELGTRVLFGRTYTEIGILKGQLIFIICLIALNSGAILLQGNHKNITPKITQTENDKFLLYTSLVIAAISIPAAYYVALRNFILSQMHNYRYLYGEAESVGTIVTIAYALFFPSLIGILFGSNYKKNYRTFVYIVFAGYAILALLCGDRGEWINKLVILLWAENRYNKKISFVKALKYVVIGVLSWNVISAIVSVRNVGISYENVTNAMISPHNNPLVSLFLEFGNTMGVNIISIQEKITYPYGNSYLVSILTMPTSTIGKLVFGSGYRQLGKWFSIDYLHINTGADFSIIAEAVMNYGQIFAPIVIFVLGVVIFAYMRIPEKSNNKLISCLVISTIPYLVKCVRSTSWYVLSKIFLLFAIYIFVYLIVRTLTKIKSA